MLAKKEVEHTNDQFVFCDMVRQADVQPVTNSAERMGAWRAYVVWAARGLGDPYKGCL